MDPRAFLQMTASQDYDISLQDLYLNVLSCHGLGPNPPVYSPGHAYPHCLFRMPYFIADQTCEPFCHRNNPEQPPDWLAFATQGTVLLGVLAYSLGPL